MLRCLDYRGLCVPAELPLGQSENAIGQCLLERVL